MLVYSRPPIKRLLLVLLAAMVLGAGLVYYLLNQLPSPSPEGARLVGGQRIFVPVGGMLQPGQTTASAGS